MVCLIAIILLFAYVITTSATGDFSHYLHDHHDEQQSHSTLKLASALSNLPYTSWFFVGIEMIPLVSYDAYEVSRVLLLFFFLILID